MFTFNLIHHYLHLFQVLIYKISYPFKKSCAIVLFHPIWSLFSFWSLKIYSAILRGPGRLDLSHKSQRTQLTILCSDIAYWKFHILKKITGLVEKLRLSQIIKTYIMHNFGNARMEIRYLGIWNNSKINISVAMVTPLTMQELPHPFQNTLAP